MNGRKSVLKLRNYWKWNQVINFYLLRQSDVILMLIMEFVLLVKTFIELDENSAYQ